MSLSVLPEPQSADTDASAEVRLPTPDEIFSVTKETFDSVAERVLAFQRKNNPIYRRFSQAGLHLPIAAFKHGPVCSFDPDRAEAVFRSSGTGQGARSSHFVRSLDLYHRSLETGFRQVLGEGPFTLLAFVPEYATDSSLVYMLDRLMKTFGNADSGFLLDNPDLLDRAAQSAGDRLVLFGAAFGLLKLAEESARALPQNAIVVETGGLKTHRQAMGRTELHETLAEGFRLPRANIWSEFGMCELLSQCYSTGTETFRAPPWMTISVRNPLMPQEEMPEGAPGVLAVVDLANAYSASAILTEDRAVKRRNGFEVLGRLSATDLRGCNFLFEDH